MATKVFDFTITQARNYTIKLEACNASYTGAITATAQPVYSQYYDVYHRYTAERIQFFPLTPLYQYSETDSQDTLFPRGNSVLVPTVALSVAASGRSISIAVPLGTGQRVSGREYLAGVSPKTYLLTVRHNGAAVLTGVINIAIQAVAGTGSEAGFSICNAKAE